MSLQTDLRKMEQEFKSVFPNVNFASLIDKEQKVRMDSFLFDSYSKLISENVGSLHSSELDDQVSHYSNFTPELANNAPALYSVDKANCYVSAVSYYNFSKDGYHTILDSGILSIDKPLSEYVVYGWYLGGKRLEISDKSTKDEWQEYIAKSSIACANEYPFISLFDADIEQFKAEIHGKILASFGEQITTEL